MDENLNDPAGVPVTPPGPGYYPPPPAAATTGLSDNSAAALAYLTFIPAIIFLVMEPYNRSPFVRFHAFQCIGLSVLALAVFVLQFVLMFIPILGFLINLLLMLGLFVIWIITVLKASKGEWFKLPVIGDFAMKQAQS